jgi:putative transposase
VHTSRFNNSSAVLDTHSWKMLGWSMVNDLKAELVLDAVNMAVCNRRPAPGLIHRLDRGPASRC